MSGLRFRFDIWTIILIFAWAVMALLLIWPLSTILLASFHDNDTGAWSLTNYVDALSARSYRRAIGNTFLVGFGGMIGALLLGTTLAFLTTRFRVRGRALVQTLAVVALVSPPFIGAYAWIVLFGANGVARNSLSQIGLTIPTIYGAGGVILVFAFKFFPHVFLIVSGALGSVNRSVEEAAESLGMSPMRRLLSVTFPLILPSLTAAALLTFVLSIADFGTPRLIGRDLNVLATEAFGLYTADLGTNPGLACALNSLALRSQRWMLTAADISSSGPLGLARAQGLAVLYSQVLATFVKDDDPGSARTMARLDRALSRGEWWAGVLDNLCRFVPRCRTRRRSQAVEDSLTGEDDGAEPVAI